LKELQEKAAEAEDLEGLGQLIAAEITASPGATQLSLGYGTQVIDMPRTAPYNLTEIKGRTLVNLLGRDGNCEDLKKNGIISGTGSIDITVFKYGVSSIKAAATGNTNMSFSSVGTYSVSNANYYLYVAEINNADIQNGVTLYTTRASNGSAMKSGTTIFVGGGWNLGYVKLSPTDIGSEIAMGVFAQANLPVTAGQKFNTDGLRVYQITATEYAAIDSMAPEQIAAKYPYVDDMKPITNPYVIKYGENLLPPFSEWTLDSHALPTEPYKLTLSATGDSQNSFVKVPIVGGATYTYTSSHNAIIAINLHDANGNYIANAVGSSNSYTITAPAKATYADVYCSNDLMGAGTYTYNLPMLNLGSTALPFKPKADDYLFFPNVQLASNVNNTVYDTLFKRDGRYWKLSRFKTMDLDGNLPWGIDTGVVSTELKNVYFRNNSFVSGAASFVGTAVKYDEKVMKTKTNIVETVTIDEFLMYSDGVHISISNADSGWGSLYTPTPDEIKAYFYGWRMYKVEDSSDTTLVNYDGTGTKAWGDLNSVSRGLSFSTISLSLPTRLAPTDAHGTYKPYKIQYQLATPTLEEIAVEGDITMHEGLNRIEVGNGMIVREKADPVEYSNAMFINSQSLPNNLQHPVKNILSVFKNNKNDGNWFKSGVLPSLNGSLEGAGILKSNYDPSAAYTVTYLALDQYALTCNMQSIQGEYASNLKKVVDTLAANQADISTRVGTLENTKAQKEQSQWISVTSFMNGWSGTVSYKRRDTNTVMMKGIMSGGIIDYRLPVFILPKDFRPTQLTVIISTLSNNTIGRVNVNADGTVNVEVGSSVWVSMNFEFTIA
jgi:hypothetical protein